MKNIDERLGRIEQTLNDLTSSGRTSRADTALQNSERAHELNDSSKLHGMLKRNEIDARHLVGGSRRGNHQSRTSGSFSLALQQWKRIPDDLAGRVPFLCRPLHTILPAQSKRQISQSQSSEKSDRVLEKPLI